MDIWNWWSFVDAPLTAFLSELYVCWFALGKVMTWAWPNLGEVVNLRLRRLQAMVEQTLARFAKKKVWILAAARALSFCLHATVVCHINLRHHTKLTCNSIYLAKDCLGAFLAASTSLCQSHTGQTHNSHVNISLDLLWCRDTVLFEF